MPASRPVDRTTPAWYKKANWGVFVLRGWKRLESDFRQVVDEPRIAGTSQFPKCYRRLSATFGSPFDPRLCATFRGTMGKYMYRRQTRLSVAFAFCALLHPVVAFAAPRVEDVAFTAKCDNTQQRYVMIYPDGFKPNELHHLMIALHGHGSDRWQFARTAIDEARSARDAAAEHRMLFISPDYRATTSWMGPKAEADVVQIIDELKARFKIGKVIVCGGSMGGSSALSFAAMHPERTDGVAAMNGTANHLEYERFQDAIAESFGGTKAQIPREYKKRSAEYWPERLTMPVGITAGGKDDVVPPGSVVRLAGVLKKLQPNVLLIVRESGGHSTNYADGKEILEFVVQKAGIGAAVK
jgi:pimeloyl-ACP methyl ester carboxylesterase